MYLDFNSLDDYVHALQSKRDALWAADRADDADRLQETIDQFVWAVGSMRSGSRLSPDEAAKLRRAVAPLTGPSDIQVLVPFHRWDAVYQATMKLLSLLERASHGKPVRRVFGLTF